MGSSNVRLMTRQMTSSRCAKRSSKVIKSSSASIWVYSESYTSVSHGSPRNMLCATT